MFLRLILVLMAAFLPDFSRQAAADPLQDPRTGDCADMIDPGSALYQNLYYSRHSIGVCRRVSVGGDHVGALVEVQVDRDPTKSGAPPEADLAPQLSYIRVTRIEANPTRPIEPNLNQDTEGLKTRPLSDKASVVWGSGTVDAIVFRWDGLNVGSTNACLYAETWGSRGGFTRAYVCWSVNKIATDADVLNVARDYVAPAFQSIRP